MGRRSEINRTAAQGVPDGSDLNGRVVADAVSRTIAYADVFDYPLTAQEVHRYLIGVSASPSQVYRALHHKTQTGELAARFGFFTLARRQDLVDLRSRREVFAQALWPQAVRYGRLIGGLPFVRLVAVTGSLAVDNVEPQADIDYLIVTEPGRLWLCRALTILVVRLAATAGIPLCPNYFLSLNALVFQERNLYTARELAQMVPLSGKRIYRRMRQVNEWTTRFLPNATHAPRRWSAPQPSLPRRLTRGLVESALRTPPGAWLERWEMERKIARFANGEGPEQIEAAFCPDWCKGHFDGHGQRILQAYAQRIAELKSDPLT
ncbi:MAG TPA: hypothetical protein VK879_03665 [Candidatus Sulfomarinibacteraceae bacterium]|nr:hypothetical protein [Candidatus Sulfomarinibacteraceae bacterium]